MSRLHAGALLLALSACAPAPPAGQVVARVDGVEITRRDVLIELLESGASEDVDTSTIQPEMLDRIIVRKLMAQEARRRSIDRSPEFLGKERRSRELILGDQLMQRLTGRLPPPSQAAVSRFVDDNRTRFDRRRILRIDRIVTVAQAGAGPGPVPSIDRFADRLNEEGRAFERTIVEVDSITLPAARLAALDAGQGRPVATVSGDRMSIEQILSAVPRPLDPTQRRRIAETILRNSMSQRATASLVRRLQARAQIDYQAGFAPR